MLIAVVDTDADDILDIILLFLSMYTQLGHHIIAMLKMTGETPEVRSDKGEPREKKERKGEIKREKIDKKREKERKGEQKREKEKKREKKMSTLNSYQSAFNSQKLSILAEILVC